MQVFTREAYDHPCAIAVYTVRLVLVAMIVPYSFPEKFRTVRAPRPPAHVEATPQEHWPRGHPNKTFLEIYIVCKSGKIVNVLKSAPT